MRLREIPAYPFLLAIWPPLALAAKNPLEVAGVVDLVPAVLAGLAVATLVLATTWWMTRDPVQAAIATTIISLGFWWFRSMTFLFVGSPILHAMGLNRYAPGFVALATLGLAYITAVRGARWLTRRTSYLNLFAVLLAGIPAISLVRSGIQPKLADLIGPSPRVEQAVPLDSAPDIFVLIVDSYAGQTSLLQDHGFDNTPFLTALRQRGFFVPARARGNYTWTFLALASMLNWDYVDQVPALKAMWPPPSLAATVPAIADNRTVRRFLDDGYEFVFAPSSAWFVGNHPWADRKIHTSSMHQSEYSTHWARMTPFLEFRNLACRLRRCTPRGPLESAEQFDQKFSMIAASTRDNNSRPLFVFAHLTMPHEPYVYSRTCEHIRAPLWADLTEGAGPPEMRLAYIEQIECLNRRLLAVVDTIMARAKRPPIIVLQSDHGQRYGLSRFAVDSVVNPSWFDIFAAYHVPSEVRDRLYDQISPVNAFRVIFADSTWSERSPIADRAFVSAQFDFFNLYEWIPDNR